MILSFIVFLTYDYNEVIKLYIQGLKWLEMNPWKGGLSLLILYSIAIALFVPGFLIAAGAGFAFT